MSGLSSNSSRWRWLLLLRSLGLEVVLPLVLLGLTFWFGGAWLTNRLLSRSAEPDDQHRASARSGVQLATMVLSIKAELYVSQGKTLVTIATSDPAVNSLQLDLPTAEFEQVESLIAQELDIPIAKVRELARYQIRP